MPGYFFRFWGCCALSSERGALGSMNVRRGEGYLIKSLEAETVENLNNKSLGYQLANLFATDSAILHSSIQAKCK